MIWIKLTRPDGRPVWFSTDAVTSVEDATQGEAEPPAKTRLVVAGAVRFVVETPEEVLEIGEYFGIRRLS